MKHQMEITLNNNPFLVEITFKNIKHLYLRIFPPNYTLQVSAPYGVPFKTIAAFIDQKSTWILQKTHFLQEQINIATPTPQFYLWGKGYTITERDLAQAEPQFFEHTCTLPNNSAIEQFYHAQLESKLAERLPLWLTTVNVTLNQIKIRKMKTRWGSCNTKAKRIWVNLWLAQKPLQCLDYLLVHELCHLHEANHSHQFWQQVEAAYPNWRAVRKELNQILPGNILE